MLDTVDTCLAAAKDFGKIADACRERLEQKDCARNRLALAGVYEHFDQLDKAEEIVRTGLQREPNDFMLRLAQADLLLVREDPESLHKAGELLVKLEEDAHSDDDSEDREINYAFAGGIYSGLRGRTEQARRWLKAVQKRQPEYPGIEDALKALDE